MGTRGYKAYRYKRRYYRIYLSCDSYPSGEGDTLTMAIPQDATLRSAWINQVIKNLEETAWFFECSATDAGYQSRDLEAEVYQECEIVDDNEWALVDYSDIQWTYIIDLDNRTLTVNGIIHFNLDRMPAWERGISDYIDDNCRVRGRGIPEQHIKLVTQWPNPNFDVSQVLANYNDLQPLVMAMESWGPPTWDTLSPSQALSVALVKTIVSDYKEALSKPHFSSNHSKIAFVCWKVACAAATSHLLCPSQDAAEIPNILYVHTTKPGRAPLQVLHHAGIPSTWSIIMERYYSFKGCLVAVRPRLHDEPHMKLEINDMVVELRRRGIGTCTIGIIISSYQMLAVVVSGTDVCHSPVLDIHSGQGEVREGLLLLIHLLSPTFTVQKTPWIKTPIVHDSIIGTKLPEELVRYIVHLTDDNTRNFVLPLVSRRIRRICTDCPRVGNYTLLASVRDGVFRVLCATESPTIETYAKLIRTNKRDIRNGLLGTFQHHQTGSGEMREGCKLCFPDDPCDGELHLFRILRGQESQLRIQVVEGMWGMEGLETGP